jgi:hypothetical protein
MIKCLDLFVDTFLSTIFSGVKSTLSAAQPLRQGIQAGAVSLSALTKMAYWRPFFHCHSVKKS